jgi:hypothetical protein
VKYAFEMGSGVMILHTKFRKDWFKLSKVDRRDTQAHRHTMEIKPILGK